MEDGPDTGSETYVPRSQEQDEVTHEDTYKDRFESESETIHSENESCI